jgi:hypothetical protein
MHRRCVFVPILLAGLLGWERAAPAADPTTADCLAASDASHKFRNQHKLRAQRGQLLICAAPNCPGDIRKECMTRVDEVNPQIPTVAFSARAASGTDLIDVKVTMDGEVLTERLGGTSLSVDPGEHSFTFETAGQNPVTKKLVVVQGQKDRQELITFGPEPQAETPRPVAIRPVTPPGPPVLSPAPASSPPEPGPVEPTRPAQGRRTLAITVGSVGLAGIVTGAIFGGMTFSAVSSVNNDCPTHTHCSQQAFSARSTGTTYGTISDVGFIAGAALLATGITLWFTAPREPAAVTGVQVVPGGLRMTGTF